MIPADIVAELLDTIFDLNGIATKHMINGVPDLVCIVGVKNTGRSPLDGTKVTMFEVMVKKTDISFPEKRKKLNFDGTTYTVENVKDDGAVITITLSSFREGQVMSEV